MQTLEGGKNLRKSMIERYGSEEAWKEVMRSRGRQGGTAPYKGKKGFAANIDLAREAGKMGGHISKRGKVEA